ADNECRHQLHEARGAHVASRYKALLIERTGSNAQQGDDGEGQIDQCDLARPKLAPNDEGEPRKTEREPGPLTRSDLAFVAGLRSTPGSYPCHEHGDPDGCEDRLQADKQSDRPGAKTELDR